MSPELTPFPRPEWSALPQDGCVDVAGKVIVSDDDLLVALLRFGEHAKIHEHAGATDTLVSCLEGEGFTSVGGETVRCARGSVFAGRAAWCTVCGPTAPRC